MVRLARLLGLLLLPLASTLAPVEARAQGAPPTAQPASDELAEAARLVAEAKELARAGKYAEALPLAERALMLREKALGGEHPDVGASLNQVGALYIDHGFYDRALVTLTRSLAVLENALGPEHLNLSSPLNSLAGIHRIRGVNARAEPLLLRALAIDEKAFGRDHLYLAPPLNNLAALYRSRGDYDRAEALHLRVIAIREKALGPDHPSLATSLNNLANVYQDQGAYARADALYVRALRLREKAFSPDHPLVAAALSNLVHVYLERGDLDRAEPLAFRALEIREKAYGTEHMETAWSLRDVAQIHHARGAYDQAEPIYLQVVNVLEAALGPDAPSVAEGLQDLATLYSHRGELDRAEAAAVRALRISEQAFDPDHPAVARDVHRLAYVYLSRGNHALALPLLERGARAREYLLHTQLASGSEPRKLSLLGTLRDETHALISLQAHDAPENQDALRLAFRVTLQRKGRVLDVLTDASTSLRRSLTPGLHAKLDELSDKRAELSARLHGSYNAKPAEAELEAAASLREAIERLEGELAAASAAFRTQAEPITLAKVQAALPPDAALVEFVRYRRFDTRGGPKPWREERYLAYLLRREGPPRFVELGEASALDAAVGRARAALTARQSGANARGPLRALDALLLAPIRTMLGQVPHLLLAPDGQLNLLPFEALVDEQGRYLLETAQVTYLSSGRDLLRLRAHLPPRSGPLVLAGPDYGPGKLFAPLPGAKAEADEVRAHFPRALLLEGGNATKLALARLRAPAFLHIATHGFFRRPGAYAPPARSRGLAFEDPTPAPAPTDDPVDALDRAGLALAGANQRPEAILSARELAGLDLGGTQLVVLSTCESGVGQVASGEGVYGLRRALVVAGAASQVTSLWDVSDAATTRLMGTYYGELAAGRGRSEALRQARLELLHSDAFAHPYYWAAFVPAGDWRPLEGSVPELSPEQVRPLRGTCGCHAVGVETRDRLSPLIVALGALVCLWFTRTRPLGGRAFHSK